MNWRQGYYIPSLAACLVSGILHVFLPLVPGLPALSLSATEGHLPQLSAAMSQLWVIEATILGAVLVAIFFAFGSVRDVDPPSATLDGLLADIGFGWVLAVFASALLGSTLTMLMLQNPGWRWSIAAPSVGALPLLDFVHFTLVILSLLFIVTKAVKYLYPNAVHGLTLQQMRGLATVVGGFERREREQPVRMVIHSDEVLSIESDRIPPPSEVRQLKLLFTEIRERGSRANAADDPAKLYEVLDVLTEALRSHYQLEAGAEEARRFHDAPLDDQPYLWDLLSPTTPTTVEGIVLKLLDESSLRSPSRCAPSLTWFGFSIWADGLEIDSHRLSRLGLELAGRTYWAAASTSSSEIRTEWVRMWRDHPSGPEHYLRSIARPGIVQNSENDQIVLHHLLCAHEVCQCSMAVMHLALFKRDRNTFLAILSSIRTVTNLFWPVEDPDNRFSPAAQLRLSDVKRVEVESLLVLTGVAGVLYYNGEDVKAEIDWLIETIKEKLSPVLQKPPSVVLGSAMSIAARCRPGIAASVYTTESR